MSQRASTFGEQATQGVGEGLGLGEAGRLSLSELTLTPQKRKALPKLQWHPATCTHLPRDCEVSLHHLPLPIPT